MSDIDDELLALAGGDSDGEGSVDGGRELSASPPPKRDAKKGSSKKPKRRARDDESEEEGEASSAPGSPNSLASAAMDESDSDDEGPRDRDAAGDTLDEEEKYPVDGMYQSEAEKHRIMGMREVEREQILADRVAEIEAVRRNRLLRQMVASEERKQAKKKRSADTAELEDDSRQSARQRTGKGETAMDALRRQKAEKQRRREVNEQRRADGLSPQRRAFNEDESDDDDFGRDHGRDRSHSPDAEPAQVIQPPELKDFERVRLGRNEFAQVCFTPGFESAITGCFIRIALGPHPDTGVEQYRMALIKGFTTSRPYALNGPNGSFVTDQYVKAAHGNAVKEFPFIAASSGAFSESELKRYETTCNNEGVRVPTKTALSNKVDDINNLINHNWTQEEIKARIARKNEFARRFDPQERARVARLLEEARDKGDDAKVDELTEELDKLGSQRLAFKTSLGHAKTSDSKKLESEQDRLAERNRLNRQLNADAVRKAQMKEKMKVLETEKAIKRGEIVKEDPSRRLRTKAKFVHDINESQDGKKGSQAGSATSTPANGTPSVGPVKGSNTGGALPSHLRLQEEKNGVPGISKPLMDDDVIGSLDLDIDVEI